ncbi:MAG: trypsin-like serine protease [Actinobacteria bacterium]|nr:trypsin-like serine protease [Actinomycetota bacterium]
MISTAIHINFERGRGHGIAVATAIAAAALTAFLLCTPGVAGADDSTPTPPTTQVVGGNVVPNLSSEWPFIVALLDENGYQFCGGTLIKPTWVVTAAHCDLTVGGVLIGRKQLSGYGGEIISVIGNIKHPQFTDAVGGSDVRLLKLSRASTYASSALPLASAANDPAAGATAQLAGWGDTYYGEGAGTDDLLDGDVQVESNASCLANYGGYIISSMICAAHYSSAPYVSACQGDSGGPLVYNGGSGLKLVGITSFGINCALPPYSAVFTRVSSFKTWIEGVTGRSLATSVSGATFDTQMLGTSSAEIDVPLVGAGDNPVSVSSASVTNANFKIVGDSCTSVALPADGRCDLRIVFSPTMLGNQAGDLVINSDDAAQPTLRLPLSGMAIQNPNAAVRRPVSVSVKQSGRSTKVGARLTFTLKVSYQVPVGTPGAVACLGSITAKAKISGVRGTPTAAGPVAWSTANCVATIKLRVLKKAKRKRATITISGTGNNVIAAPDGKFSLRIK